MLSIFRYQFVVIKTLPFLPDHDILIRLVLVAKSLKPILSRQINSWLLKIDRQTTLFECTVYCCEKCHKFEKIVWHSNKFIDFSWVTRSSNSRCNSIISDLFTNQLWSFCVTNLSSFNCDTIWIYHIFPSHSIYIRQSNSHETQSHQHQSLASNWSWTASDWDCWNEGKISLMKQDDLFAKQMTLYRCNWFIDWVWLRPEQSGMFARSLIHLSMHR